MSRFLKFVKQLFCEHIFGNAEMNPYVDQYGNHSAVYTCLKCGKREVHTFYKD